ncbi:hypothetical protein GKC30_11425 [Pseudodesulfovibrio sp. F-1]|uniref:Uncharacterized protein n=1 Tax=Pseudodesulfovibrio alkaliphilus TaxID=2661613 RepID=A0A7K1KQ86_9BACT|nr:hypothetical protein [Pseudodesulfovibrio alkaliphilus]MUM78247.1 hypothetical protein [Pseudodesulfovibrio alkaliphilus]
MRTYVIEDLYDADYERILKTLDELNLRSQIEGMYYLPLPVDLLQPEQRDHLNQCGPYFMALETVCHPAGNQLRLELLVRARSKLRCSCVCYATASQRKHMIEYLDQFIEELEIAV